jgi:uncharacterized protein (TIGR02147 family)
MITRPNIFLYEDYRGFLRDLYQHLKATQRGFSHRFFSQKAGFTSPNMLQLVIDGKRNVTPKTVGKFVRGLKLNQQEAEFFASLVAFNQAATPEEKSKAFQGMTKSRKFREIHELSKEVFRFYTQWFHIVIREMIDLEGFKADPEWIAQNLLPSISKDQAERALKLLLKLNLIKKEGADKGLERTDPIIATAPEVKSLAVVNYHQSMMTLAAQSLSSVPGEERDITSATVGFRQEDLPRIKKKIEAFRKTLLAEMETSGRKPDRIYQLNIQLFPVTQKVGGTK